MTNERYFEILKSEGITDEKLLENAWGVAGRDGSYQGSEAQLRSGVRMLRNLQKQMINIEDLPVDNKTIH